jgi:endoglucanase
MKRLEDKMKTVKICILSVLLGACSGNNVDATDLDGESAVSEQRLSGVFHIRARHSGQCMDIAFSSSENFANLVQYNCHGGNNQLFQFNDLGNGFHQIRAYHSNKCLDVINASAAASARIVQYDCHGGTNQEFQLVDAGDGYVRIIARNSNQCLDVIDASAAVSAQIVQYPCHGGYNQQFKIE